MRRVIKGLVRIFKSYEIERQMIEQNGALASRVYMLETMLMDEVSGVDVLPDHKECYTEAERTAVALAVFRKRNAVSEFPKMQRAI